jgi:hypothetical protein
LRYNSRRLFEFGGLLADKRLLGANAFPEDCVNLPAHGGLV